MTTYFSSFGDADQGEVIRQVGNTAHHETWNNGPPVHELVVDGRPVRLLSEEEQDAIFDRGRAGT